MSLTLIKCEFCRHYTEGEDRMCCDAFPDGIPLGEISDDITEECANGIKFEEE